MCIAVHLVLLTDKFHFERPPFLIYAQVWKNHAPKWTEIFHPAKFAWCQYGGTGQIWAFFQAYIYRIIFEPEIRVRSLRDFKRPVPTYKKESALRHLATLFTNEHYSENYLYTIFFWRWTLVFLSVMRIRNDLFRIRIQLWIFWVPGPGKSSGSTQIRTRIQPTYY